MDAANPSAAAVLQLFVDLGAEDLLKKLNVNSTIAALIVDAINILLKDFASEETIDQFMDNLREKLASLPVDKQWIEKLFEALTLIVGELENVMLFLYQLVFQHVTSYAYLMGTSAMHPLSQSIINSLVTNKKLNGGYTNIIDKQSNAQLIVEEMTPVIGSAILNLLTPDFLHKNGWDKLL